MPTPDRIILGIETSCDDTSLCVLETSGEEKKVLALNSYSQDFMLKKWGGVVPELEARNHVEAIPPLLKITLDEAGIDPKNITDIAVTTHPGLIGPLLTGMNLGKTFALLNKIPMTSVNHLFAHLEAIHLTEKIQYPYLGLLVSGGHTAFWWVKSSSDMEILGTTLDDAAGEAFDKGGKLLGVGYPAGRIIDDLSKSGDPKKISFPISYLRDRPGKMSFSGLKTSLRVRLEKMAPEEIKESLPDLCAGYQEAIVQTLRIKTEEIIEKILNQNLRKFSTPIVVGGGVACNSRLREILSKHFKNVHFVAPKYCTDNAGMIAHWAALNPELRLPFPECLEIDALSKVVEKK